MPFLCLAQPKADTHEHTLHYYYSFIKRTCVFVQSSQFRGIESFRSTFSTCPAHEFKIISKLRFSSFTNLELTGSGSMFTVLQVMTCELLIAF